MATGYHGGVRGGRCARRRTASGLSCEYLLPTLVAGLLGTTFLGWLVARAAGPRQRDSNRFWVTVTVLTVLGVLAAWGAFVLSFMLLWTLG